MNIAIIGANRGIGLELCRQLVEESVSNQVYAFCRKASPELLKIKTQKTLEGFDVAQIDEIPQKLPAGDLPTFDQVIYVAGIHRKGNFENLNQEDVTRELHVNATAPLFFAKNFLSFMKPHSKMIFLSSQMGSIARNTSGGAYGYRMSKAALNSAVKSLSWELRPHEITVLALHPGWVKTDMTNHNGLLEVEESAQKIIHIVKTKGSSDTGSFWHVNGEEIPW